MSAANAGTLNIIAESNSMLLFMLILQLLLILLIARMHCRGADTAHGVYWLG
mgnify:CR=1 FL=1